LSPSKNFFSRQLSPDKTRKSHLDYYDNAQENREFRMNAYFGTSNGPLERYINSFFVKDEERNNDQDKKTAKKNTEDRQASVKKMSKTKQLAKGVFKGKK
jgi:hypothetical protein